VDASRHSRLAAVFLRTRFLPETARVTVLSIAKHELTTSRKNCWMYNNGAGSQREDGSCVCSGSGCLVWTA
jgi:hypothetical protein